MRDGALTIRGRNFYGELVVSQLARKRNCDMASRTRYADEASAKNDVETDGRCDIPFR